MALFWLSSALGILGFAALMLAIPPDDAQLLGEFPESYPNCDRKPRRRFFLGAPVSTFQCRNRQTRGAPSRRCRPANRSRQLGLRNGACQMRGGLVSP
jgi:hypothetical protein